jgi:hypothetical protein
LSQSFSESLDGQCFFAFHCSCKLFTFHCHLKLGVSSTIDDLLILDSLHEDTESIVKRPLSFIQDMLTRTTKHDCARFVSFATRKLNYFVFSDQNFLYRFTRS